ncbi:hypothetical protein SAMN02745781_00389 [Vibrio gazogenes DSM 21264]|uniref:Uncharacterized protein n=1 Tax=Vibrio gazogenes DSM 21264 = NBRC 103151 TaxID=1123492 RepID=A0A1M4TTU3_VIBGA|nr:hypothetical protein SAMN02745781_00389 [Vibrio gazogenes DSM 21264] [Vibrio gazogenes DSM 21264 = NBRC 103151]SJN53029.1 hypothetical protein BQ6471_00215 [Vibrio gazogenes]
MVTESVALGGQLILPASPEKTRFVFEQLFEQSKANRAVCYLLTGNPRYDFCLASFKLPTRTRSDSIMKR